MSKDLVKEFGSTLISMGADDAAVHENLSLDGLS